MKRLNLGGVEGPGRVPRAVNLFSVPAAEPEYRSCASCGEAYREPSKAVYCSQCAKEIPEVTEQDLFNASWDLCELRYLATLIRDPGGDVFCANRVWYWYFKPRLTELVGWYAAAPVLRNNRLYDLAYKAIYNELPGCRNCACMPPLTDS